MNKIELLTNVCKWLQRQDKNGEYVDMIEEYHRNELDLEVIQEVCKRVLNEWIDDLKSIPNPSKDDLNDITFMEALLQTIL